MIVAVLVALFLVAVAAGWILRDAARAAQTVAAVTLISVVLFVAGVFATSTPRTVPGRE